MTDWEQRYLDLAQHISTWSKDPSRQIGAVVVGDSGQILSIGYNGFPRGINDDERLHDVVMNSIDGKIGHWTDHWKKTKAMFDEANVQYRFL